MAVYKDNATGTWRVVFRYTDFTGERKQTQKRGFQTKRDALAWEREQLLKLYLPCFYSSTLKSPLSIHIGV